MNNLPGQRASRPRRKGGVGILSVLVLAGLVALPAFAIAQLTTWVDWKLLVGVPLAVSIIAYFFYRSDKRRAEAGEWRIPESTLHAVELMSGWPGAFLAQRIFRHKISKGSYQFTFWLIVFIHQFVALDSLLGWSITRKLAQLLGSHTS